LTLLIIGGGRQARSPGAFLVAEVAFVTILLVAAILVVTSFVVVTTADPGFDRRDVMMIDVARGISQTAPVRLTEGPDLATEMR
jgi:hypothetical protein